MFPTTWGITKAIPIRSKWETPKIHNGRFCPKHPNFIQKKIKKGKARYIVQAL